jgi:hypothetical protein
MEQLKSELKGCLNKYRNLDDQLRELNKLVYDLREKRKMVEVQMGDILKVSELSQVGFLKLEDDNSSIKIQRPGTYSKPWSLSKRDLQNYLDHYFENARSNANPKDCFDYIVERQKEQSVEETDFKFIRNVVSENIDNQ